MTDLPVREKAGREEKTRQSVCISRSVCSLDEQLCYCLWASFFSPTHTIHPAMIYPNGVVWYIIFAFPLAPLNCAFVAAFAPQKTLIGHLNQG